jgi:hypothetical protein
MLAQTKKTRGDAMIRPALPAAVLAAALALAAPSAQAAPATAVPDWTGIWTRVGSLNLDPTIAGREPDHPPYIPAFSARFQQILAAEAKGTPINDKSADCLPPGLVRMMNMVYPMEILQTRGQFTIVAEWMGQIRRIFTDGRPHPAELDPTFNGHSIGHWENGTLLIDTVGIRGGGILDDHGAPLGDNLHVTERFWQADPDTLKDEITLQDPTAFTASFSVVKTFKRAPQTLQMMEYVCEENNRNPTRADGSTGAVLISR